MAKIGMLQQIIDDWYNTTIQYRHTCYLQHIEELKEVIIEAINRYELYYLKDNNKVTYHVLKRSLIGDAYKE